MTLTYADLRDAMIILIEDRDYRPDTLYVSGEGEDDLRDDLTATTDTKSERSSQIAEIAGLRIVVKDDLDGDEAIMLASNYRHRDDAKVRINE